MEEKIQDSILNPVFFLFKQNFNNVFVFIHLPINNSYKTAICLDQQYVYFHIVDILLYYYDCIVLVFCYIYFY